jgi:hypothetical protein
LIFPPVVVSYGCGTWLLPFNEEFRLMVVGRRVLREIFGPGRKKDRQIKLSK